MTTFCPQASDKTRHRVWHLALAALIAAFIGSPALAQQSESNTGNWPQWRGPRADGTVTGVNPPLHWNASDNLQWKREIPGEGSSTPIIWKDRVFVLSAEITSQKPDQLPGKLEGTMTTPPPFLVDFCVWCLDRESGDIRWKQVVHTAAPREGRHPSTTYAAASPVTDGESLFVSFGSYGIFRLDLDGQLIWERQLGEIRTRRGWGEAVSPVLHQGRLIVNWDQEDQSQIFVLDATTGKTVWEKQRDEPTTWATPLVVTRGEVTQVITNGTQKVRSYDLESGDVLWQSQGTTLNAIPCPILDKDHVICMAGYRGNAAMSIPLDSRGDVDQQVKWQVNQHTPYVPSPVLTQGRLYFTKSNQAILNCLDVRTGEPVYELTRLPGLKNMYASPVATDNRIYLVSREGVCLVLANEPEFRILATNDLGDGVDSSPALVGDQLFLRSKTTVYCFRETTPER